MAESTPTSNRQRDSGALMVLGSFFAVMGSFVLLGVLWEDMTSFPALVDVCGGAVLLLVGGLMLGLARRWRSKSASAERGSPADNEP